MYAKLGIIESTRVAIGHCFPVSTHDLRTIFELSHDPMFVVCKS